jgi:hypothetical protein
MSSKKGVKWTVFHPATMVKERIYEEAEHPLEKIYARIPCRSACIHCTKYLTKTSIV